MDISDINNNQLKEALGVNGPKEFKSAYGKKSIGDEISKEKDFDSVDLSGFDKLSKSVREIVDQTNDIDVQKVQKIREQIRNGEFNPSSIDIAESMGDAWREELLS